VLAFKQADSCTEKRTKLMTWIRQNWRLLFMLTLVSGVTFLSGCTNPTGNRSGDLRGRIEKKGRCC